MAGEGEAPRRKLFQVTGLQRSGNHAVINWLASLAPGARHDNDLPHDFFTRPENLAEAAATRAEASFFSFEDARGKLRGRRLLESVVPVDPAAFPDFEVRRLYILRDPYNCWASRVKAQETTKLTSAAELAPFLADWTELARACVAGPEAFVLYNSWFRSRPYRQRVCARLGGSYSERTLGEVLGEGGGSSFDGFVRPSYRTMLGKAGYYLTPEFRRRFLQSPRSYLARLFASPIDGRALKVESRWESLVGRDDARALFEDAEVGRLSREIFGFSVGADGAIVTEPPRAAAG